MPPYAGFSSLSDYIDQRCAREGIARSRLGLALGRHSNYVHCICIGQFSPSRAMADAIAGYFGDDVHVVRVLAGLEAAPPKSDRQARELADLFSALEPDDRAEALRYLEYLRWRSKGPTKR